MIIDRSRRRDFRLWSAAVLAVVAVFAACRSSGGRAVVAFADSACPWTLDLSSQPMELKEDVDKLQSKYHGCLTEIAAAQDLNASTVNNQTQTDIPADPMCTYHDVTTSVQTGEYANAGLIDPGSYGSGTGKRKGFIVAKVKNLGRCATAAPLSIPAGATLLWIVDVKGGATAKKAHLVFAGSESDLLGKKEWQITACNHPPGGSAADAATIKFGNACQNLTLQQARDSVAAHPNMYPSSPHRFAGDPEIILWMTCGGDCCYTDS